MAKHFLRNDIYWIDYRYGGKRIRQSLKTSDPKAAKALLARLEDNLQRVENGSLAIPNGIDDTEFLLSDGRSRSKPDKSSEIRTLRQLCNGYLAGLRNDSLEASTIKGIKIHIKHLLRDLRKSTLLSHINLDLLQEYVDRRSKQRGRYGNKIRPATIKKELVTLRIMWKWARRHDLTPTQPVAVSELQYSKVRAKPPFQTFGEIKNRVKRGGLSKVEILELSGSIFLTQDEVEQLLLHVNRVARQPFVYPMFAFAAYTGARRSELLRSKVEDIDFESGFITIQEKKRVPGTITTRRVPISPRLRAVLEDWFAQEPSGDYTFCKEPYRRISASKTIPLTPNVAQKAFKGVDAGSSWEILQGWHVFRHSFCSNCAAAGVDQRTINAWVGHQTIEMERRYQHLQPNKQREDIRKVFGDD